MKYVRYGALPRGVHSHFLVVVVASCPPHFAPTTHILMYSAPDQTPLVGEMWEKGEEGGRDVGKEACKEEEMWGKGRMKRKR